MEFRLIPSLPDYEVSRCGIVRSAGRPSVVAGKPPIKPRIISPVSARPNYVSIRTRFYNWLKLRNEAWPECADRTISLQDLLAERRGNSITSPIKAL